MGSVLGRNPGTVYAVSEGQRFAGDATLVVVSCATCGVMYAIPESFDRSARAYHGDRPNGWKICCPFGHSWCYVGETDQERLKRQLAAERDRRASLSARLDQAEASRRGLKAAATRARNDKARIVARVGNGVCPCCNRTFKQLARHMAAKHPGFPTEPA